MHPVVAPAPPAPGSRARREVPVLPDESRLVHTSLCGTSINPYRRCDIRCGYCINAAQGASVPVVPRDRIPAQLRAELAELEANAAVGVGTVVDAYPSVEHREGLARTILETLAETDHPYTVVTKSLLVERDADVLLEAGSRASVMVSLSTLEPVVSRRLEPGAPLPEERARLVERLADRGIDTRVSISPWIPGTTDLEALLRRIPATVPTAIAPLNVAWRTGTAPPGLDLDQEQIDARYLAEVERLGTPDNVAWLATPSSRPDGAFRLLSCGPVYGRRVRFVAGPSAPTLTGAG